MDMFILLQVVFYNSLDVQAFDNGLDMPMQTYVYNPAALKFHFH